MPNWWQVCDRFSGSHFSPSTPPAGAAHRYRGADGSGLIVVAGGAEQGPYTVRKGSGFNCAHAHPECAGGVHERLITVGGGEAYLGTEDACGGDCFQ